MADSVESAVRAETFTEARRRGWTVSIVSGRAGKSRVSALVVGRILRREGLSKVEAVVDGAVIDRARANSKGALEVTVNGKVEERLLRWCVGSVLSWI